MSFLVGPLLAKRGSSTPPVRLPLCVDFPGMTTQLRLELKSKQQIVKVQESFVQRAEE